MFSYWNIVLKRGLQISDDIVENVFGIKSFKLEYFDYFKNSTTYLNVHIL